MSRGEEMIQEKERFVQGESEPEKQFVQEDQEPKKRFVQGESELEALSWQGYARENGKLGIIC